MSVLPSDVNLEEAHEVLRAVEASIRREREDVIAKSCLEGFGLWNSQEKLRRTLEQTLWLCAQAARDVSDFERALVEHIIFSEFRETIAAEEVERSRTTELYTNSTSALQDNFLKCVYDGALIRFLINRQCLERNQLVNTELCERIHILRASLAIESEVSSLEREVAECDTELGILLQGLETSSSNVSATRGSYGALCSTASSLLVSPSSVR
jgi:hypothetical protein